MQPEGVPLETIAAVARAPVSIPLVENSAENNCGCRVATDACAQYNTDTLGLLGGGLVLFARIFTTVLPPGVKPFCFANRHALSRFVLGGLFGEDVQVSEAAVELVPHCVPLEELP